MVMATAIATGALAQQPAVKIGVIAEFSGPFADYGTQIVNGMKTYLKLHGDTFGGRKVEFIQRDTTGAAPDIAKRLAQELITRDNVDILAGFGLTPNALAVAPIDAEAKKPMVIMNAATSIITTRSPYIVRVSHTLPQDTQPIAQWAAKNGIKRAYTLISDYGPGIDAEGAFVKAFKAAGGEIIDSVRSPLQNPDFAPYLQRIKDSKPDAVFVFLPPGSQTIAFIKGYEERGLKQAGVKLIGTGDLTDDGVLQAMGEPTLGLITSFHYSASHDSPENKAFVKAYAEVNAEFHGMRRLRRHGGDRRSPEEDRRLRRSRQVHDSAERHEVDEPARADHDRSGDARHRADRLHPQGGTSERRALQHGVRQVSRRQGPGEMSSRTGTALVA
jgi:branched-chain amino acid transport system substrate-binding protein